MERAGVKKVLMSIVATYGADKFKITEETITVWHRLLEDQEPEILFTVLKEHLQSESWPPTPADLRNRIAIKNTEHLPDVLNEWERVLKLASSFGLNRESRAFRELEKNPHTARAVRAIGWKRICHTDVMDLHFVLKDFRREYESSVEGHQHRVALGYEEPTRIDAKAILKLISEGQNNEKQSA